jgi:thiol:disulfide interchange protein DsbD
MEALSGASVPVALAGAFAGGVLASLTPCIYPMIPIVSGYVGSKTLGDRTTLRAFLLSLAYVSGMASVYAGLGMFAALTGSFFGAVSTNPLTYFVVGNLLILLGLNLLDVFQLPRIPTLNLPGGERKGVLGAFLVGAASGLVASPCTSPVLMGLLAYAGSQQNAVFGAALLFVFSLGMGILLVVVGTFSGVVASLPKPGQWMVTVKKAMGVAMLGVGEYFLIQMGRVLL